MGERISTGIPGLDTLIDGGFNEGSVTLVSGGAGTGKTIFCAQFLWEGVQNDENTLFITLEEEPGEILRDAEEFGWDFSQHADDQFDIIYINPFKDSGGFVDRVRSEIKRLDADRIVVDSTSVMGLYDANPGRIRERLYDLVRMLRHNNVTSVITSEIPRGEGDRVSRYGVEEFIVDGVIVLYGIGMTGKRQRRLIIEKMRRTDFGEAGYPIAFTENGLEVQQP